MAVYGLTVWIVNGLIEGQAWVPFISFVISTFLMMEMNTSNALIRIYSRMVSCSFIALMAMASPLLNIQSPADDISSTLIAPLSAIVNTRCSITCLLAIASYIMLFRTYQNRTAMAHMFYGFMFLGLASMLYVEALYYVPALWLLNIFSLQAASWRNFFASILGLITPYWFAAVWFVYQEDFSLPIAHFSRLADVHIPADYSLLTANQIVTFAFILAIGITGTVHYIRTSFNDKIRIRMLYNFFIAMNLLSVAFIIVQPQHYNFLIRMMIINTSPLIAHFIALTHTRVTNIAFYLIVAAALLITGYNIWTL